MLYEPTERAVGGRTDRVLGLSLFPAIEPYNGGSNRIYNIARNCSQEFDVTYLAQSFTFASMFAPRWETDSPAYREFVCADPLSMLSHGAGKALRVPQLAQSTIYRLTAPRWARRAAASAAIITVQQPWLFAWAARHRGPGTAIVYDAQNVEAQMFEPARIRGPRRLARALAGAIDAQERDAVRGADLVFTTSDDDARIMANRYGVGTERFALIPNGVDCSFFRPAGASQRAEAKRALGLSEKRVVLFCGAKHPPNREAVEHILQWAARDAPRDVHFLIVGSVGSAFAGEARSNVSFTGFVPDVRPYLAAADVAVNPVSSGSGTNVKQVEYMAAGIPTIATPFGARGIGIRDDVHGLIRDREALPAAVERLTADPALASRIAAAGRSLVEGTFDWGAIGARVIECYRTLQARRERSLAARS